MTMSSTPSPLRSVATAWKGLSSDASITEVVNVPSPLLRLTVTVAAPCQTTATSSSVSLLKWPRARPRGSPLGSCVTMTPVVSRSVW